MPEEKKRINVFVPGGLHAQVMRLGFATSTEAVIRGFERLLEPVSKEITREQITIRPDVLEAKESIILAHNSRIESLEEQLRVKDSQIDDRVRSFEEQLKVKDYQIENKDSQLEKQAVHIQSLIQENSKLNVKLLPESTKKPWYKFW